MLSTMGSGSGVPFVEQWFYSSDHACVHCFRHGHFGSMTSTSSECRARRTQSVPVRSAFATAVQGWGIRGVACFFVQCRPWTGESRVGPSVALLRNVQALA